MDSQVKRNEYSMWKWRPYAHTYRVFVFGMLRGGEVEDEKQKKIICRKENRFFFLGPIAMLIKFLRFFFFASYLILTIFAYNLFHCLKLTAKSFIIWLIDKQERERESWKKKKKKNDDTQKAFHFVSIFISPTHILFLD